jgi:hypothetical protein
MDKYNAVRGTDTYLDVYIHGIVSAVLQFAVCIKQQRQGS